MALLTLLATALLALLPQGVDTGFTGTVQAARQETKCVADYDTCNPPPWWTVPDWARCPDWWDEAQAAGIPLDWMPKVDYIMYRESRCNRFAHNPSGASGPVQWMPMWFTGRNAYGWVFDPYDPYQALLHMRLRVEDVGNWHDWCLSGDRVTGGC